MKASEKTPPVIRRACRADLPEIVKAHRDNVHEGELSQVLGEAFITRFYRQVIEDPDGRIAVVELDGRIVAFSVVFLKYRRFEKAFRRQNLPLLLAFLAKRLLSLDFRRIAFIYRSFSSQKPARYVDNDLYDAHLGIFLLDRASRGNPQVMISFYKMLRESERFLHDNSPVGSWASCRVSNPAAIGIAKSLGMAEAATIEAFPENIVVLRRRPSGSSSSAI